MVWANRNGNFYVLDRATGRFLLGKPFVKVNWMSDFDERGRPIQTPQPPGQPTYPGNQGGTNWYSPSFSPRTGLFYVSAWETTRASIAVAREYKEGRNFPAADRGTFRRARRAGPAAHARSTPGPSRRPRRGDRPRSAHRRAEVEVQHDRRHRQRHPDCARRSTASRATSRLVRDQAVDAVAHRREHPCGVVDGPHVDVLSCSMRLPDEGARGDACSTARKSAPSEVRSPIALATRTPGSPGRSKLLDLPDHVVIERHEDAVVHHSGRLDDRDHSLRGVDRDRMTSAPR